MSELNNLNNSGLGFKKMNNKLKSAFRQLNSRVGKQRKLNVPPAEI